MRTDEKGKEKHEKHNCVYTPRYRSDCSVLICFLVVLMNELVTLEQVQTGTASDEVFDLVEELKTAEDRMRTLKYQFQQLAERTGIKKWETDYFTMVYIEPTTSVKIDTKRMKESSVYVIDAETGEFEEVNAYDNFKTSVKKSAYVKFEEKK